MAKKSTPDVCGDADAFIYVTDHTVSPRPRGNVPLEVPPHCPVAEAETTLLGIFPQPRPSQCVT